MDKVLKILELEAVEKEKKLQTVGYDNNLILWAEFGSFVNCNNFCKKIRFVFKYGTLNGHSRVPF